MYTEEITSNNDSLFRSIDSTVASCGNGPAVQLLPVSVSLQLNSMKQESWTASVAQ